MLVVVDGVEGGLLKGDGQQDALVAGDAVLLAEQVDLPVDVRDVFRLSCDGKAVAAPVDLILQPEEGDVPTGPLFPEQRDRGGQPVSYTHLDVYKRQVQASRIVER